MAVVFILLLFYVSYDISQRTTFPGSKGQLKERIKDRFDTKNGGDTADTDQTKTDSTLRMTTE